jgi:hypothetical protein
VVVGRGMRVSSYSIAMKLPPPTSVDLSASRGTLRGFTVSTRVDVEWVSGGPQPCVFTVGEIDTGSSASSSE